jgi:hypothetical protein
VPVKDRGKYVGLVVSTIAPFCPSVIYAQLIARSSNWRYNGILIGVWNFVGLVLCVFCYNDPSRLNEHYTARHVLGKVDWVGGFLSIVGVTLFMMGLQWGAIQVSTSPIFPLRLLTKRSTPGVALTTLRHSFSVSSSSLPFSYGRSSLLTPWYLARCSTRLRRL